MKSSDRKHLTDITFDSNISDENYSNHLFTRVISKGREFRNIDFKYTIFDTCYFRKCVFDSCDFTGCRFYGTNLVGSNFDGCRFDYAIFERTQVDSNILDVGCPGWENLALRFARTLKTNYQGLGDIESAKRALLVELKATEDHLRKAWNSRESYYRKKYKGMDRIKIFSQWAIFKGSDLVWGNGENAYKLVRTVLALLLFMGVAHVFCLEDATTLNSYWKAWLDMPAVFLGVTKPAGYTDTVIAFIFFFRLVLFGLFMTILIRWFSRR